jgi:hypothetical protein
VTRKEGVCDEASSLVATQRHTRPYECGPCRGLVSRGAAISVPLEIVCTSNQAEVDVRVTQRAGSAIAEGFAFKEVTCEGDLQHVDMTVFASGNAFKKGTAVAEAQIFGCFPRFCGSESDTAEIAIVKK